MIIFSSRPHNRMAVFMKKASRQDKQLIIEILVRSFEQNASVGFIVGQGARREERLRALMSYSFDCCYEAGCIYLNEEQNATALVLFPDAKRTSLRSVCRDLKLIINVIGITRLRKVLLRNKRITAHYPRTPFCYLWFIGVMPGAQQQGLGSRLLAHLIGESEQMNRPMLLETSVPTNIAWYQQMGFRIYHEIDLGYKLYFLERSSGTS